MKKHRIRNVYAREWEHMNRKTKHFPIVLILSILLFLALVLTISCGDKIVLKHEAKHIESEINQTICIEKERIKCTHLSYHEESSEVKMYFDTYHDSLYQAKYG